MCGIVGYIGKKDALPILIDGLKRLEYRGYDSAGESVINNGRIYTQKRRGKIKDLQVALKELPLPSANIGIAHTRWATHGAPNYINAHPHLDCKKRIALVHNGIIENYQELKSRLIREGHRFISQTDTEVLTHLIEKYYRGNLEEALRRALKNVRGTYALGIISVDEPDTLFAARNGSPLVVGVGRSENFIASDVPALLGNTRKVIYLEDGQLAKITRNRIKLSDLKGKIYRPRINSINWDVAAAQKHGYPHFMLKEIHEQPRITKQILSTRIKAAQIHFQELVFSKKALSRINNIIIVACGTAYHAGLVGKYIIEQLSGIPVWVDLSSEFRYRNPIVSPNTLVIAISQSGETADTLAAVREARSKGAKAITICNVVDSSIVRESDGVIYTYAGPEIGVASTKAYTAQLAILYLLGIYLAEAKRRIKKQLKSYLIKELRTVSALQDEILHSVKNLEKIAKKHSHFGSFLYLGRNINFPSALEGALKLKEISYIPAEGYAAGEMKHGPIALIDEYRAVVCISPESSTYEKMVSNMQEIKARRGRIIAIATRGNNQIKEYCDEVIYMPKINEIFSPLLVVIPLQLLAYFIAVNRGCDVDQPRNLAKSVTVE